MNSSNTDSSESAQLDLAREELQVVEKQLRETRKILNRDWPMMSPRERSSQSRIVKEIEQQRQTLLEKIETADAF